jgi:short-subunit dehydrogenase
MNLAKNKSALITGASSGIGKATALAFAKAGIDVALVSRNPAKLAAVANAVQQTGVKVTTYPLDLADIEQVREKISAIAVDTKVDILINSAGMGYTGNLSETPLCEWQAVINLNLTSVFQCILGVLPTMRDRGTGTIINIASIAGVQPFPSWGAYSVSKAGLIALSKTLAAEERQNGIRVTTVSPGAVDTELWNSDTVGIKLERSAMLSPESVAQSILHTVLLPQQAVIEELTLMPNAGVL